MLIASMVAILLAQDGPYKIANGVSQPRLVSKTDPNYSSEARTARLQGMVELQIVVDIDGKAHAARVIRSLGLGLDEAALDCVKQWRFKPGEKDGEPVATLATAQVNYVIGDLPVWRLGKAAFKPDPGVSRPTVKHAEFPKGKPQASGSVELKFTVDEHGEPKDLLVAKSDAPFESEVVEALQKWRFKPALKNGTPVAVPASFIFVATKSQ